LPGELGGGGLLEEEGGGQGLAGDVQIAEDDHHLVGELADFGGRSLRQIGDRQIQGGEGGVEGVAFGEKRLADLGEELAGLFVIAEAGGNPPLHPIQAEPILRAAVCRGQLLQFGEEICRLLRPAVVRWYTRL
jgi:hypothetical protein